MSVGATGHRRAARTIDASKASGCCPGIIDIHTHYYAEVLATPVCCRNPLRHGVTTIVMGSCSLSTVPADVDAGAAADLFGRVEAIPHELCAPSIVGEHKFVAK